MMHTSRKCSICKKSIPYNGGSYILYHNGKIVCGSCDESKLNVGIVNLTQASPISNKNTSLVNQVGEVEESKGSILRSIPSSLDPGSPSISRKVKVK